MHTLVLSSTSIELLRIDTYQLAKVIYAPLKTGGKKENILYENSFTLYVDVKIEKDYPQHDKRSTTLLFLHMTVTLSF
jgi:hypothetical protein